MEISIRQMNSKKNVYLGQNNYQYPFLPVSCKRKNKEVPNVIIHTNTFIVHNSISFISKPIIHSCDGSTRTNDLLVMSQMS